jgi:hypothetical protein
MRGAFYCASSSTSRPRHDGRFDDICRDLGYHHVPSGLVEMFEFLVSYGGRLVWPFDDKMNR